MNKLFLKRMLFLFVFLILSSMCFTGCTNITEKPVPKASSMPNQAVSSTSPDISVPAKSKLTVHFIDVGQADCILIQNQKQTVLIDAGNYADYKTIYSYLQKQNVRTIDVLVLTHPHEDHIGSAAKIVQSFNIGTVYMTKASPQTRVFKSLREALSSKRIKPLYPKAGDNFSIGETAFTFLGPVAKYSDLNSMSLVLRADFGANSFLFTGDSTDEAEHDMLNKKVNLESQVLKVAHHGSRDSSSYVFLKAVNPEYSVISTETGNDYGHPHKETLSRLNDVGTTLYRTDKSGTIVATSNGKKITWNTEGIKSNKEHMKGSNGLVSDNDSITYSQNYIGNKTSKIYHRSDCSSLPKKENQIKFSTRQKAESAGYKACGRCNP